MDIKESKQLYKETLRKINDTLKLDSEDYINVRNIINEFIIKTEDSVKELDKEIMSIRCEPIHQTERRHFLLYQIQRMLNLDDAFTQMLDHSPN